MPSSLNSSRSAVKNLIAAGSPISIDLGSSTTKIGMRGSVVLEEPTCIVLHTSSGAVVAVGAKAQSLVGKTPPSLNCIFPIQQGVVAHPEALAQYLKVILSRVLPVGNWQQRILGVECIVGIPGDVSPARREQLVSVLRESGLHRIRLVSQPIALVKSMVKQPALTESYLVLDIGGQTVGASIFSGGDIFRSKTLSWGGVHFTQLVQDQVKEHHGCVIGWHEAEKTKINVGTVPLISDGKQIKPAALRKYSVRGKDTVSQLSKTVVVASTLLEQVFGDYVQELVNELELFCFDVPSEMLTSALEQGIFITGGGSQVEGIALVLSQEFHCQVHASTHPTSDTALGLL